MDEPMTMRYAKLMQSIIGLILVYFISFSAVYAETVYKTVDENGNVIFTDKATDDAEKIEVEDVQTIKQAPMPSGASSNSKKNSSSSNELYHAFSIVKPANGEGYRNNAGTVSIQLSLQPSLIRGHSVVIKLDGEQISKGSSLSATLENVDRGEHTITAQVISSNGKVIISATSSFTLLRVALGGP
jgi:hypothetical protein